MPQYPTPITIIRPGSKTALNVTAAGLIRAARTTLYSILIQAPGSGGVLTINDDIELGDSNGIGNQIISVAFNNLTAGQPIKLNWPCLNGIVLSAMPTDGAIAISYNW